MAYNEKVIEHTWRSEQNHGAELLPAIQRLLGNAGAEFSDIDSVGVATGPGRFSALRVGLSTAKGLVMPRKLPLIGISTYDIEVMSNWPSTSPLVVVIDAGSLGLAWALYGPTLESSGFALPHLSNAEIGFGSPDSLVNIFPSNALFCGEAVARMYGIVSDKRILGFGSPTRHPANMVKLANQRLESGELDDPSELVPNYGRKPSISIPKSTR